MTSVCKWLKRGMFCRIGTAYLKVWMHSLFNCYGLILGFYQRFWWLPFCLNALVHTNTHMKESAAFFPFCIWVCNGIFIFLLYICASYILLKGCSVFFISYLDSLYELFLNSYLYRQLEQEMETVVKVLQPGPLGIIEHKFSAEEIRMANATVHRAVENWQRNAKLEQSNPILKDYVVHKWSCGGIVFIDVRITNVQLNM